MNVKDILLAFYQFVIKFWWRRIKPSVERKFWKSIVLYETKKNLIKNPRIEGKFVMKPLLFVGSFLFVGIVSGFLVKRRFLLQEIHQWNFRAKRNTASFIPTNAATAPSVRRTVTTPSLTPRGRRRDVSRSAAARPGASASWDSAS